jgi:hypothetical protein
MLISVSVFKQPISNESERAASTTTVIPRESGVTNTLRPPGSIADVSEYWIARRSLSSGGHSADPLAGDNN